MDMITDPGSPCVLCVFVSNRGVPLSPAAGEKLGRLGDHGGAWGDHGGAMLLDLQQFKISQKAQQVQIIHWDINIYFYSIVQELQYQKPYHI